MFGSDWDIIMQKRKKKTQINYLSDISHDKNMAGIIPRVLFQLFEQRDKKRRKFSIKIQFIQIYNEKIFDMIRSEEPKSLDIRENK